jgi:hypothetical protein
MIRYFQSMLNDKNAYDVAVQVGKHTNIVKELFSDKTTEGLSALRERTGITELHQRVDRKPK